jgi:rhodanese-related sulfurtransferase
LTERRSIDEVLTEARGRLVRVDGPEAADAAAAGGLLVDIRPLELRRRDGEIPGAAVVGRNVLEWRLDPTSSSRLDGIDGRIYERVVVVVCDEGYASSLAARDLQRLGIRRATDLIGGFQAWRAAGLPVAPPTSC